MGAIGSGTQKWLQQPYDVAIEVFDLMGGNPILPMMTSV